MDLRFAGLAPSAAEQAALDDLLGRPLDAPASNWRGNGSLGQRRHLLLPALHAVHDAVGWISRGALDEIARRLEVAPADVFGVASFYGLFSLEPRPLRVIHVCTDLACRMAGSGRLVEGLDASENAALSESPCLGVCERAPAVLVTQYGDGRGEAVVAPASPPDVVHALTEGLPGLAPEPDVGAAVPQVGEPGLVLLRRVGVVEPTGTPSCPAAAIGAIPRLRNRLSWFFRAMTICGYLR